MTTPHRQGWKDAWRTTCAAAFVPLGLALAGLFTWPASPSSATEIYHSPADDGVPAAGVPVLVEGGVRPIYLYVNGGATASAPGTVCDTGQGDEVCGFTVTLSGAGGLGIDSFSADATADLVVNQSAGTIVINHIDPVSPAPGPQRIGVL